MKKKIIFSLLAMLSFLFIIESNILTASASTVCSECTEEVLCDKHSEENSNANNTDNISPNAFDGIIVEDENDEGFVLLGEEDETNVDTCSDNGIIVEDENDEGFVLLGEEDGNVDTCNDN